MAVDLYGPSEGLDPAQPVAGVDLYAPDPNAPGPFKRGFGAGVSDLKSIGGGLVQMAGRGLGVQSIEDRGAAIVQAAAEESAPNRMQVEDVGKAFEQGVLPGLGASADLVKYAIGNQLPMLATMVAGGVGGRVAGALVARGVASTAAKEAAVKAGITLGAETGATLGVGASAVGMEAGQIFPEAVETGVENPIARTVAGALGAGALDTVLPVMVARRLGLIGAGEKILKPRAKGFGAVAKEAGATAGLIGVGETTTEALQTVIERAAAGQSLTDDKAMSDYLNSAVIGGIMGLVTGGVAGGVQSARRPVRGTEDLSNQGVQNQPEVNQNVAIPPPAPVIPLAEQEVALHTQLTQERDAATAQMTDFAAQTEQVKAEQAATVERLAAIKEELKVRPTLPFEQQRALPEIKAEQKALQTKAKEYTKALGKLDNDWHAARKVTTELAPKIDEVASKITTRYALETTPAGLNPAIKPRSEPLVSDVIVDPNAPAPVAQEEVQRNVVAIQTQARDLGMLHDLPASKLSGGTGEVVQPVQAVTETTSREVSKEVSAQTRQGAIEYAVIQSVQPSIRAVVDAKPSMTEGARAKQTDLLTNALNSVAQEAAALPSPEAAKAHIRTEAPKALKGRVDKGTAQEITDVMVKAVDKAPTFYSRGAAEGTTHQLIGQILQSRSKTAVDVSSQFGRERSGEPATVVGNSPEPQVPVNNLGQVAQRVKSPAATISARPIPNATPSEVTPAGVQPVANENAGVAGVGALQEAVGSIPTRAAISKIAGVHQRLVDTIVRTRERGTHKSRGAGPAMRGAERQFIALGLLQHEANYLVTHAVQEAVHGKGSPEVTAGLMMLPDGSFVNPSTLKSSAAVQEGAPFTDREQPPGVNAFAEAQAQLGRQLVDGIKSLVGERANLTVSTFTAAPGAPIGGYTRAGPYKAVINLAVNAKNPMSLRDHEAMHYIVDNLLDARERAILRNGLKHGTPLFNKVMEATRRYDVENNTNLADEVASIPAEAEAYGFQFWRAGELQVEGALRRVFEKILAFLEKIANMVRGLGFQSVESIFEAIDRGQFAEREAAWNEGVGGIELNSRAAVEEGPVSLDPTLQSLTQAERTNYSQAAAMADRDFARRFANGELEQTQFLLKTGDMLDNAQHPESLYKLAFGATKAELGGSISRWLKRNINTPNFIGMYSNGYKNVQQTLNTYVRYRKVLVKTLLQDKMPEWYDASATNQDAAFNALLERTVKAVPKSELAEFKRTKNLTAEQSKMFDSATTMVEGFLRAELESDRIAYAKLLTTPGTFEKWIANREAQVADLIDKGYIPLRRYGDHMVDVYTTMPDAKGRPILAARYFYENERTAVAYAQIFEDEIKRSGVSLRVERGARHKNARDTTISAQQFLDTARRNGVALTQVARENIVLALSNADAMIRNRMMRREGYPGYSRDGMRVLNEFGVNMSGKMAYAKFASAIDAAVAGQAVKSDIVMHPETMTQDVTIEVADAWDTEGKRLPTLWQQDDAASLQAGKPGTAGFFNNLSDELVDYVLVPDHTGAWSRKLRTAAMTYFIGGSISGAMVNAMSVPMLTVPQLSVHTNYWNALSTTMSAWKQTWQHNAILRDVVRLKDRDNNPMPEIDNVPGLRQALIAAADHTMDTEIHQIMGISQGAMFSQSRKVQKAMDLWMKPFRVAEQTNRITSFIAAYRIGRENNLAGQELFNFAGGIVDSTQNNYGESNRPGMARHPIYAMMFMFKSFPLFMTEAIVLMHKANPKAAVFMLLGLVGMTGIQGLPFAETIQDLIDTIAQRLFNSPFNTRRAMRNVLKDASEAIVGYDMSEVVLRGLINEVFGMSVSSRIGAGDFVPGSRLGTADADMGRTLEAMMGAPASMVIDTMKNAGKFVGGVGTGDWKQAVDALRAGGPIAIRNVIKGTEQFNNGYAMDARGQKLVDISGPAAFWQLFGLSSAELSKAYELDQINRQTEAFYTQVRTDMQGRLVAALKAGDGEKVKDVWEMVTAWDASNPEMPLALHPASIRRQIMLSNVRLDVRTTLLLPRALRGTSTTIEGMNQ